MTSIIINAKDHTKNIKKVLDLLDNKSIPKQIKEKVEELLNVDDDVVDITCWDSLANISDDIAPSNASLDEVKKLENSIREISKGV